MKECENWMNLMLFFLVIFLIYVLVSEVLVYELLVEIFTVLYSNKMNNLVKIQNQNRKYKKKIQHYHYAIVRWRMKCSQTFNWFYLFHWELFENFILSGYNVHCCLLLAAQPHHPHPRPSNHHHISNNTYFSIHTTRNTSWIVIDFVETVMLCIGFGFGFILWEEEWGNREWDLAWLVYNLIPLNRTEQQALLR